MHGYNGSILRKIALAKVTQLTIQLMGQALELHLLINRMELIQATELLVTELPVHL